MIELEYAAADFGYWKSSITEPSEFGDLESLLSKLTEASRAVQIAISALKGAIAERSVNDDA